MQCRRLTAVEKVVSKGINTGLIDMLTPIMFFKLKCRATRVFHDNVVEVFGRNFLLHKSPGSLIVDLSLLKSEYSLGDTLPMQVVFLLVDQGQQNVGDYALIRLDHAISSQDVEGV